MARTAAAPELSAFETVARQIHGARPVAGAFPDAVSAYAALMAAIDDRGRAGRAGHRQVSGHERIRHPGPAAGVPVELETLRDQRDLYRSLLLSELTPLAASWRMRSRRVSAFVRRCAVDRDAGAFRGKNRTPAG